MEFNGYGIVWSCRQDCNVGVFMWEGKGDMLRSAMNCLGQAMIWTCQEKA